MKSECYLGLISRERRAEAMVSWNIPSFLPFPQALSCRISRWVLLTEEMLIHGPELQETLFPGEETSLAELPAPSLPVAAACPRSGPAPRPSEEGQGPLKLSQ